MNIKVTAFTVSEKLYYIKGVARTQAHQSETTEMSCVSAPLYKNGDFSLRKELTLFESKFFPLRAVLYSMGI